MFATMSGFLWFFFIGLIAIFLGIIFEHRLIQFEYSVGRAFLAAIHNQMGDDSELLDVRFMNGKTAQYHATMFDFLISDPDVAIIISAETGELYYDPDFENYIRRPCGREMQGGN